MQLRSYHTILQQAPIQCLCGMHHTSGRHTVRDYIVNRSWTKYATSRRRYCGVSAFTDVWGISQLAVRGFCEVFRLSSVCQSSIVVSNRMSDTPCCLQRSHWNVERTVLPSCRQSYRILECVRYVLFFYYCVSDYGLTSVLRQAACTVQFSSEI